MANRMTEPKGVSAVSPVPGKEDPSTKAGLETLNFKVKSQFKREYKGYAVSRGMTMVELLEASYQLYKEKHHG
jgi:hypothetical protein